MKTVVEKDIRQEVKDYIDRADDRMVRIVHAMLEADQKDDDEYEAEMEKRFKEYEDGKVKGLTWDQVVNEAKESYERKQQGE